MTVQWRPAIVLLVMLSLITGLAYPLAVTGLAQLFFAHQAHGSLLIEDGERVGSALIGQAFDAPQYFWPRPSATVPFPYNATASAGSNLGPTNPALIDVVKARLAALHAVDPDNPLPVPVDLVTASASGLDPHISRAAAEYQIDRVARVRGVPPAMVRDVVAQHTQGRQWGLFGEPRVNVLLLNRALDAARR